MPLAPRAAHAQDSDAESGAANYPSLLVASPADSILARYAALLGHFLAPAFSKNHPLALTETGGADGVTGANQFETRVAPDGQTALLAPGAAALTWLAGDMRVHFDASRWVPVMAGVLSSVVIARQSLTQFHPGAPPRVAVSGPVGPEMPVMLAMDLLGLDPVPVFGIGDAATARTALAHGAVDMILLRGPDIQQQMQALAGAGQPVCALDAVSEDGALERDPALAGVPRCGEIITRQGLSGIANPSLLAALQAAIAASRLDFTLVLPQISPAATVALWRRAAGDAALNPNLTSLAGRHGTTLLAHGAATSNTLAVVPTTEALLQLRQWLARRMNWRPA